MKYLSTRNADIRIDSSEAILRGISDDGGLFVPAFFPKISIDRIAALQNMSYKQRAAFILNFYLTDMPAKVVEDCTDAAYSAQFDDPAVAPLRQVKENEYVLELWHGPTLAFKDMALQLLPRLMNAAKAVTGRTEEILILVATSGDTGKAALEGFKDVKGTAITVFYPQDGVSQAQKLQMITQTGANVHVCAVQGNFDDAQTGVKRIFADEAIKQALKARHTALSSANSINWGRLVPQIAYYFSAYAELLKAHKISAGQKINFVVPTGNFGNILAGYYAKLMGLPIHKLICASNINNVLTDFFHNGQYNAKRAFHKTISPSMDILISSNLERLLFELSGRNAADTAAWMESLKHNGQYDAGAETAEKLKNDFWASFVDDRQTLSAIHQYFTEYAYLMDTHTAVAQSVYDQYVERSADETVTVVLSTASPYKFAPDVLFAIDGYVPEGGEFAHWERLSARTGTPIPGPIAGLKGMPVLHKDVCTKEDMDQFIKALLGKGN